MAKGRLGDHNAAATVAVRDAEVARRFYEGVLGLRVVMFDGDSGVAAYASNASRIDVYVSAENAGRNPATSVTYGLGDAFEAVMASLTEAGVTFEHYDGLGLERRGDVHVMGDFRAAWFKDPDGNILHINSG